MGSISVYGEAKSYCYGLYMRLWRNKVLLLWSLSVYEETKSYCCGLCMGLWRNKVLLLWAL
jgi:hypothetical protein